MNRAALSHAFCSELRLVEQETSLRILVAEDDDETRRLLTLVLRRDGHDIVETEDGADLLEVLASTMVERGPQPFDVVICAHALPGIPGLTVLAGLRSRDRITPFILITGDADIAARARRLGAVVLDPLCNVRTIRGALRGSINPG